MNYKEKIESNLEIIKNNYDLNETTEERQLYLVKDRHDNIRDSRVRC